MQPIPQMVLTAGRLSLGVHTTYMPTPIPAGEEEEHNEESLTFGSTV